MRVPAIRRVVVGVSGTLGNLAALHAAAALARRCDAELVAVHAGASPDVVERAVRAAFGGPPAGVTLKPINVAGAAPDALVRIAGRDGDVLVVGSGRPRPLRRRPSRVSRYCVTHASCVVLTVPPPPLIRELGRRAAG